MPHHNHTTVTRSCQLRSYQRLYLVIRAEEPFALCARKDGKLLAWTDWADATKAAVPFKGFVTNWDEFRRRSILSTIPARPPAMRIHHVDKKGVARTYHAEFDATAEELRTLNEITAYWKSHTPDIVKAKQAKSKVWEEIS